MKEIVTLQVGGFANFVGSHFWNFQDEILGLSEGSDGDPSVPVSGLNMDVIYRVGETLQGRPTYTPRLISIDSRGSAGAVSSSGTLYQQLPSADTSSITTWKGPALTFKSESNKKNKFLQSLDDEEETSNWSSTSAEAAAIENGAAQVPPVENMEIEDGGEKEQDFVRELDDGVQYWTDYLKAHLHSSTIYQIPGVWVGEPGFEHYGSAKELISGAEMLEEIGDRIRHFVEECDHLQGFECLVEDSTGFSSVAANVLGDLSNEYAKGPICLFTVRPPDTLAPVNNALTQRLHDVVSFVKLASLASVIVPIGLPNLSKSVFAEDLVLQDEKPFHSSALYAAAVTGITLPYRMETYGPLASSARASIGSTDMGSSLGLVTSGSTRPVALLEVAFPAPAIPDAKNGLPYKLQAAHVLISDTKAETLGDEISEMVVSQGARLSGERGPAPVPLVHETLLGSTERWTRAALNMKRGRPLSCHFAVSSCPLAIPLPFPSIFPSHIGRYGDILSSRATGTQGTARGGLGVVSTPLLARLSTSGAILPYIERRQKDLHRLGMGRGTRGSALLDEWGFATEEVQELYEGISRIRDGYRGRHSSETSDDDGDED